MRMPPSSYGCFGSYGVGRRSRIYLGQSVCTISIALLREEARQTESRGDARHDDDGSCIEGALGKIETSNRRPPAADPNT
jgi:hypothetical protein